MEILYEIYVWMGREVIYKLSSYEVSDIKRVIDNLSEGTTWSGRMY